MASQPIYQFYAELNNYQPKIWRRFQVPGNITMARLGYILMTLYEMQASHLFCITVPVRENAKLDPSLPGAGTVLRDGIWRFELNNEELFPGEGEKSFDASAYKTRSVLQGCTGEKQTLEYDYGDGWEIEVTLETILEDKELPGRELPRVLAGEGYGIIEDCGGTGGLERLAEAFRQKNGDDYVHYKKWLGRDDLDLDSFDLDDMNQRLKKVPRIYTELYEYGCAPSQRSLDFLERKYQDNARR